MNKKLTVTGINIFFLVFSLVFIFYQIVLGIVFGQGVYDHIYAVILVNELVVILGFVTVYSLVKKVNIKDTFRINNPGFAPMVLIAIISVPAYFVASALNSILIYLLQFIGEIPSEGFPVPQNIPELLLGILIVAVVPGICEELLHRGLILRAYERRGSYRAVVIVSIIFGIFHFDITNLLGPIFLGLIIGYYVVRTNSIFAGIWAHFLNNTIATVLQYIWRHELQEKNITLSADELFSTLAVGAICFGVTTGLLIVFREATRNRVLVLPPISSKREDAKSILSHWPIIIVIIVYILMSLLYILTILMTKVLDP